MPCALSGEQELTDMRQRIQRMRQLFVNTLQEKARTVTSALLSSRTGCSLSSGLTKRSGALRLREEFGVYAVASGRKTWRA